MFIWDKRVGTHLSIPGAVERTCKDDEDREKLAEMLGRLLQRLHQKDVLSNWDVMAILDNSDFEILQQKDIR